MRKNMFDKFLIAQLIVDKPVTNSNPEGSHSDCGVFFAGRFFSLDLPLISLSQNSKGKTPIGVGE
jgi:hypothetical protein